MIRSWFTGAGLTRLTGLIVLAALLVLRVADPGLVTDLRNRGFDLMQAIKPRDYVAQPVTIIDIDDRSLRELGQWPWPRDRIAELLDRIAADGAVLTALDILFAEPDRLNPADIAISYPELSGPLRSALKDLPSNDQRLADAIGRSRVVLGQTSIRSALRRYDENVEAADVQHAYIGGDGSRFLLRFPDLVQNLPELEAQAAGRGVFTVRPDRDGIYRRVPLALMTGGALRLALAAEVLRVATGGGAIALRSNAAGIDALILAGRAIRTGPDASVMPYYSVSRPGRFVSAVDVLSGAMPEGRLKGQLVLIGTSAIGLEDYRATPLGVAMPGVEIHAQVVENILTDSLLKRPNYAVSVELALILGLGLLVVAIVPAIGARWGIVLTLGLLAGILGAIWYMFDAHRVMIDPSYPFLSMFGLLMFLSTGNYVQEEQRRRQIRGAFRQYVSPDLVAQLAATPDRLQLGGERRELTVLFSDVRDFTALAESYNHRPEALTTYMNRLLTALSQAILSRGGTIDKFMGDAVMAFWNAPVDRPGHALDACRAALRMVENMRALNRDYADDPTSPDRAVEIGIGLNTGPCIVGNMGSDDRFDYTALGDTVNLASRLEGQAKNYGVPAIIGEQTWRAVRDDLALIELDLLRVKGRQEPSRVFGLLGDEEILNRTGFRKLQETNAAMLAAYRNQDWQAARAQADALTYCAQTVGLDLDLYLTLYRDRIDTLERTRPAPGWGGVMDAVEK